MNSVLFGLASLFLTQNVPQPPPKPVPVLVVSGANNHDWEWSSRSLERILEGSGRFDVTVTTDPAAAFANPAAYEPFAAFVLDYNGVRWGEPAESNFLAAVAGGKGVVVVHAANNAFRGWIEYEEMCALCWRDGTGHGRFHAFDVRITDRDHPTTRTLPDLVRHPDELYHALAPMHGTTYRVLADALSARDTGGTGAREPMIVVKEFGKGRVFHTPLGHVWKGQPDTHASHEDPQFANLIRRGTEWAATGDVDDGAAAANRLEPWDVKAGWRLLFDGETTDGWVGHGTDSFPERGWVVESGALRHVGGAGGGDLVTRDAFGDFELTFDWMVAGGANSGVKYRVAPRREPGAMLGPEYQMLDDVVAGGDDGAKQLSGAIYAVVAADSKAKRLAPVGTWNRARIVADGERLEHWLNGALVASADLGSDAWSEAVADSKFASVDGFARGRGPIGLQDHGGEAWVRSIKIRDLAKLPGRDVTLFDGESLAGWTTVGDARWSVEDGVLYGEAGGGAQSFLVSEGVYGDFFLDLSLKIEDGNSGVQVRSHRSDKPSFHGYQLEVDPTERGWSGGLYDEGRRGWLQTLEHNPAGRSAFRRHGWNHYRIECVGPSIRCWVNGVPTADFVDRADADGHIALQVHSGKTTRLAWRNLRLRVLD